MYSVTWTEKRGFCSALEDPDWCDSHKLTFTDYYEAASKYLELVLDCLELGSFYHRICKVKIHKKGKGYLGDQVRTDVHFIHEYLNKNGWKYCRGKGPLSEDYKQHIIDRLSPWYETEYPNYPFAEPIRPL